MSENTKTLSQSKTFWGVLLAWLTTFLNGYGINVEELSSGSITTSALVTIFSAIALWGRLKAETKIGKIL